VSALYEALSGLNTKLEKLETLVESYEQIATEKAVIENQQDLFNAQKAANESVVTEKAAIVNKLDSTIDKVERLLKEG
jgi:hypothetical protein